MLVLVLREATVHRQLFTLTSPATPETVSATRNKLSEMVAGKTALEIEREQSAGSGELETQVIQSTLMILKKREAESVHERTVQGLGHLFEQPEFAMAPARARDVLSAVEDDESVAALARAAPVDGAAGAIIGSENPQGSFRGSSVIVCRYGVPGEAEGVLGLIGPTRMAYRRALPVVTHTASMLSRFVRRVYGESPQPSHP